MKGIINRGGSTTQDYYLNLGKYKTELNKNRFRNFNVDKNNTEKTTPKIRPDVSLKSPATSSADKVFLLAQKLDASGVNIDWVKFNKANCSSDKMKSLINSPGLLISDIKAAIASLSVSQSWASAALADASLKTYLDLGFMASSVLSYSLCEGLLKCINSQPEMKERRHLYQKNVIKVEEKRPQSQYVSSISVTHKPEVDVKNKQPEPVNAPDKYQVIRSKFKSNQPALPPKKPVFKALVNESNIALAKAREGAVETKLNQLSKEKRNFKSIMLDNNKEAISYFSKGDKINLNCEVGRNRDEGYELVMCRHLSEAYLTHVFGRGKNKFAPVSSKYAIKTNNRIVDDKALHAKYDDVCFKEALYFDQDSFSEALANIAGDVFSLPEGREKQFTFATAFHAMAIRVRKAKDGIVVYFYDPNDTARHKKIVVSRPEDVKKLPIDAFINKNDLNAYFGKADSFACFLSADTVKKRDKASVNVFGKLNDSLLYLLLTNGHYGHKNAPALSENTSAHRGYLGKDIYALEMACISGKSEAVRSYLDDLFASGMSSRNIMNVLSPFESDTPGPHLAIKDGKANIAQVYFDAVLKSKLKPSEKKDLLYLKSKPAGSIAVSRALEKGHISVGKAFFDSVLNSSLNESEKRDLLVMTSGYSLSEWVFIPLRYRVKLYDECKALIQEKLSASSQEALKKVMLEKV